MRRWLLWIGAGLAALVLVVVLGLAWLLNTGSGRDVVLGRVAAALPPGALTWERAEGRLSGLVVLHGLHYQVEDGLDVRIERAELDARVRALLGRKLDVRRLWLEGVEVRLAETDDAPPADPWQWPEDLPQLDLPVKVEVAELGVRRLELMAADEVPLLEVSRLDATGRLGDGRLELTQLDVDSDRGDLRLRAELDSGQRYATELSGSFVLPEVGEPGQAQAARFRAGLYGNLDALALELTGRAPGEVSLQLRLDDLASQTPSWQLDLDAGPVNPRLFGAEDDTPVVARLQARGAGLRADLEGRVERDGMEIDIAPSTVEWTGEVLLLEPLVLGLYEGIVRLEGQAALAGGAGDIDLQALIEGVVIRQEEQAPLTIDGRLAVEGEPDAWRIEGTTAFERDGEQATLQLRGEGDRERLRLDTLRADVPGGDVVGSGEVAWSPVLAWTLDARLQAFDPGYFNPDFPGRIDAALSSQGQARDDQGVDARVELDDIGGQLRGRALSGQAALDWRGDRGDVTLALGIGASRIRGGGAIGEVLDLAFELDPLQLQDLLPDAAGVVRGEVALAGPAQSPDIQADLRGSTLRYGDHEVETLRVRGELPGQGARGRLDASLGGAVLGGVALDSLQAQVEGSLAQAEIALQADGEVGTLDMAASTRRSDGELAGELQALRYAPPRGAPWQLEAPADFVVGDGRARLSRACLSAATARACVEADWPERAVVEARDLPLAMLDPWLSEDAVDFHVEGIVDVDAEFTQQDGQVVGNARVVSEGGVVRLSEAGTRELLTYQRLLLEVDLGSERIDANLDLRLSGEDYARGRFRLDRDDEAALEGDLQVQVSDLAFVELFSPDIVVPQGELSGRLAVAGTLDAPRISGDAGLRNFSAELPALGISLEGSQVLLRGDGSGEAILEGELHSGEGTITITGRQIASTGEGEPRRIEIEVQGADFLAADLPELRAVVSPDLQVVVTDRLHVRGRVDVDSARLDLEQLESTTSPSPDVVVVDPVEPAGGPRMPIDALVTVALGDDVELVGFGLEGELTGELRVREVTGRATTATGALGVSGDYTAYGQDLRLENGRLAWASSPIENPTLDLVAQRSFENHTVGIRVRGTARRPTTEIFSTPPMDNTEAMSWLVLGRPLRTASGEEGQQLGAAALALGAGGNYLAEQMGARLGLDEVGVADSRALGGATLSIGKYLSPRLLVSYGVSLLGDGQVLTLKYLLGRGFDIEIASGTESRAALNWRLER
ncbi:translocation/assembly module TamB domain-containing protein [Alkalisalibacterium limincola]|uniref:Translocation and assembly module TamB C-terminal domain-containing protein n=1 Tax=Alkalisalibacterium limincola TaxID=2699169 RepID=A0A5C8KR55_9GAMM|nr:translocation/assembly module TamB domain-containing protein [Alkalisalibacterium limincola]TXK62231.1 hypothetical protein FU658_08245 [Alkalisalibacterium limincola]